MVDIDYQTKVYKGNKEKDCRLIKSPVIVCSWTKATRSPYPHSIRYFIRNTPNLFRSGNIRRPHTTLQVRIGLPEFGPQCLHKWNSLSRQFVYQFHRDVAFYLTACWHPLFLEQFIFVSILYCQMLVYWKGIVKKNIANESDQPIMNMKIELKSMPWKLWWYNCLRL